MGKTFSKNGIFTNICESENFYKNEKNIQTTGFLNIEYLLNTWGGVKKKSCQKKKNPRTLVFMYVSLWKEESVNADLAFHPTSKMSGFIYN